MFTIIDILIVAVLFYAVFVFLRRTRSAWVFRGAVALVFFALIAMRLDLPLTHILLRGFLSVFVVVLVVVFQRELRGFFEDVALSIAGVFNRRKHSASESPLHIIAQTANDLVSRGVGALMVIPGKKPVSEHLSGGFNITADVSPELILSIFDTNTPGHDGAMVIEGGEIRRFAAQLPLAKRPPQSGRRQLGTRHSAGLGLSERTDALVIIISEERGSITLAENGALRCVENKEELEAALMEFYSRVVTVKKKDFATTFVVTNPAEKIVAIVLSILAWYLLIHK